MPTVVIVDLNMPRLDGLTFIRRVRSLDKDAGILFSTVLNAREAIFATAQAGADRFLGKGFRGYELVPLVESCHFECVKRRRGRHAVSVFLTHSSRDKVSVRNLYRDLSVLGMEVWLDEESLLPGQDWRLEIEGAIKRSDAVIVCCSREGVSRRGFFQTEVRQALKIARKRPQGSIFVVPVKLEECELPRQLRHLQGVNYFEPRGLERLVETLESRRKERSASPGRRS